MRQRSGVLEGTFFRSDCPQVGENDERTSAWRVYVCMCVYVCVCVCVCEFVFETKG